MKTCESLYDSMASDRLTFLNRARQCSELTIPTLIPPEAHSKVTVYYTPWQDIGARGVNNLASKLLLSLLPPNSPFFRLVVNDFTLEALTGSPQGMTVVEAGLSKIERAVQNEIEVAGLRAPIFLALKYLIVSGNVLIYLPSDGVRLWKLDSYCVKRDVSGNVLDVVAKDVVSPLSLSEADRRLLDDTEPDEDKRKDDSDKDREETVSVYTRFTRTDEDAGKPKWITYQTIKGKTVPGSEGSFPIENPPFMALRWNAIDGEDYGRSYVEEYLGSLSSLEMLTKAIVEASAVAAKVVFMINPNGTTRVKDLVEAESGAVITGRHDDVSSVQTDKQADMRIAYESAKNISESLSFCFMMNSSVQRNAERVTAEEVRFMASQLEDALGGVYSVLSQDFQLPLVHRLMERMTRQKRLPALPNGIVKPAIVTGLEALGRGHELSKYMQLMQALQPLGPQVLSTYMNPGDYISRIATSLGIEPEGLVKTDAEIQQAQQQAAQMQASQMAANIAGKAAPSVIKGLSDRSAREFDAQQQQPEG